MSSILNIGMQAMLANQAALQTIGHNISNANTAGYSRQQVVMATTPGQNTGFGYIGKGVSIETVMRAHDAYLTTAALNTQSLAHMDTTRLDQMTQLQKVFPTNEDGLGAAASSFFNSMIDVVSNASDPSARQVLLGNASNLAARFASAGQQLDDLQSGVYNHLKTDAGVVNQLAQKIAAVNGQIVRTLGSGQPPNDLLDQRDQMISELSKYVQLTTLPADDGSLGVFIGGGQRLVLGTDALQLTVAPDPYDSKRAVLSIPEGRAMRPLDESVLSGGSLAALIFYQNSDLQDARNMLGQMATAITSAVNQQQALGLDMSDPPGTGAALFSVGQPGALPSIRNARNPDGSFVATVQLTVTNGAQLQASSYRLAADPANPGGQLLTRLSDGVTTSVADGSVVDGFRINFTPGAPGPADSYLLEPVANAAVSMKRALDSINGIAAASPLTGAASVDNAGTATIDSLYAVNGNLDTAQAPMTLAFTGPDPGNPAQMLYTITLADGSAINGSWQSGTPIGNQPLAALPVDLGFELNLNGVPRAGDIITISATKFPTSNNGNAKAFMKLQEQKFVGEQLRADGSIVAGATINDAYAAAMSDIGARAQGAGYLSSASTSSAVDAQNQLSSRVGVNLDEEAARMMQFQQAYQATARVLQTAQSIFNDLLRTIGS